MHVLRQPCTVPQLFVRASIHHYVENKFWPSDDKPPSNPRRLAEFRLVHYPPLFKKTIKRIKEVKKSLFVPCSPFLQMEDTAQTEISGRMY